MLQGRSLLSQYSIKAIINGHILTYALIFLCLTGLSLSLSSMRSANAAGSTTAMWPSYAHGVVYARNLVLGDQGKPIFAEFDAQGNVVLEIGEAVDNYNNAKLMSGETYRAYQAAYTNFMETYGQTDARGSLILSRDAYENTTFKTIQNEVVTNKPTLMSGTQSVLVRASANIYTPDTSPLLFQSGLDLNDAKTQSVDTNITSVIISEHGALLYQSANNIGYRAAYIKPTSDTPSKCNPAYDSSQDLDTRRKVGEDDACGPIRGANVTTMVLPGVDGGTFSNVKGEYFLNYMMYPCPGFDFDYTHYIIPMLYYSNYNPKSAGISTYYQVHPVYDHCSGSHELLKYSGNLAGLSTYSNITGILAASTQPDRKLDILIDVIALTGQGTLSNSASEADEVPLTGSTVYATDLPNYVPVPPQGLDLDGDRIPDAIESEPKDYNNDDTIDGYGIYLNGKQPGDLDEYGQPILPDLIKRPDYVLDTHDQGLLQQISKDDLIDTDLYVYRLSNGQRIFERKTLDENTNFDDQYVRGQGIGILDDGTPGFYYKSLLRGRSGNSSYFNDDFSAWQSKTKMNPAFYQRQADHLRPGEPIKIIAINRKTGYMGSVTTTAQTGASNNSGSGLLDFSIDKIIMRPPNLKVEAKRTYDVEAGLTKGEERHYLIGFEGSGLNSDKTITLITTWADHDGSPLPDDLPGFTGRLAKIVSDKSLGDSLAEFEIKPGTHMEFMRLSGDAQLSNDHYYLQINGKPPEDGPDFSSLGAGAGLLEQRPKHYVPFKVAVYDEVETRNRRNQQNYALQDNIITERTPIDGVYAWPYRPEMQFSVLDLEMKNINKTDAQDNVIDILPAGQDNNPDTIPGLVSGDQYLDALYSLEGNTYKPLDPFGPYDANLVANDPENTTGREYVFSLGEDEVTATFGSNEQAHFSNLEHLAALDSTDFLTLRLLQNTDAENVLWEFAFEYLQLLPWYQAPTQYISADEADVYVNAIIPGYIMRDAKYQSNYRLSWIVDGDGIAMPPQETNNLGNYTTLLKLPHEAGKTTRMIARLGETQDVKAVSANFQIVPGEPKFIQVSQTGKTAIAGIGQTELTIKVTDQWSNLVADGTPVTVSVDGDISVVAEKETVNGEIKVVVKGLETPGEKVLTIQSRNAETTEVVTVENITLTLSVPSSVPSNTIIPVVITGSTPAGTLDGVQVLVGTTKGILEEGFLTFSGDTATTQLYTGNYRGNGFINARVAGAITEASIAISPAFTQGQLKEQVLVGDQPSDGVVSIDTASGLLDVPYVVSTTYTAQGTPGEVIPVSLGSLTNPVIEPVLDYPMRTLVNDSVIDRYGQITGLPTDVTPVKDSPEGIAGSYQFTSTSTIRVPTNQTLEMTNNTGFSLNFKADTTGGTLVSQDRRPQKLTLESDGTLKYEIETTDGVFTVNSSPVSLSTWHRVGAHYKDGQLLLEVDGTLYSTPATGTLISVFSTTEIRIGAGFQGNINAFKVYDWSAPLLVTFPNGTTETALVIGTDGTAQTAIISTGNLGNRPQVADISSDEKILNFFISNAHAASPSTPVPVEYSVNTSSGTVMGWLSDTASYVGEVTAAAAKGFITGAGENASTAEQVGDLISGFFVYGDLRDAFWQSYLAIRDDPSYNKVTHTLSGLALGLRLLGPLGIASGSAVSAAKTAAKLYSASSPFMKVLGKHLGYILIKVKNGSLADIQKMEPLLMLFATVAIDDELRQFLEEAIPTQEALEAWIEYLAGWDNVSEPIAALDEKVLDFFIPTAHASTAGAFADLLKNLIDDSSRYTKSVNRQTQVGEVARLFRGVISELNYPAIIGKPLSAYKYKSDGLKAFLVLNEIGGEASLKALLNHTGWVNRTVDQVVKDFASLDLNVANGKIGQEAVDHLSKVVNDFQVYFNKSHGAAHQLNAIVQAQKSAIKVLDVEAEVEILNSLGKSLGKRRYDMILETPAGILNVETKAWSPDHFKRYLANSMNSTEAALEKGKHSGQLLKDIVDFKKNGYKGIQWQFDNRLAGKEEEITDTILDLVEKKKGDFMMHLGIKDADEWNVFMRNISGEIGSFVKVIE